MKIYREDYCGRLTGPYTLEDAVELACDPGHTDGTVERMQEQIDNLRGIVARLLPYLNADADSTAKILGDGFEIEL